MAARTKVKFSVTERTCSVVSIRPAIAKFYLDQCNKN